MSIMIAAESASVARIAVQLGQGHAIVNTSATVKSWLR